MIRSNFKALTPDWVTQIIFLWITHKIFGVHYLYKWKYQKSHSIIHSDSIFFICTYECLSIAWCCQSQFLMIMLVKNAHLKWYCNHAIVIQFRVSIQLNFNTEKPFCYVERVPLQNLLDGKISGYANVGLDSRYMDVLSRECVVHNKRYRYKIKKWNSFWLYDGNFIQTLIKEYF